MGTLFIVSTPIGNLEDITLRAIKTLFSVDIIACEDTRRTGQLLKYLRDNFDFLIYRYMRKNPPQLISYYDKVETSRVPELISSIKDGKDIALVSDAGTPIINDPGYLLVREARKRDIPVVSIPGPAAFLTALTSSGLPANQFFFLGYPPEKSSHRKKLFNSASQGLPLQGQTTYIFYCAPHKLEQTLRDMLEVLGDIEITIARELTKIHEQIWRGQLSSAISLNEQFKGEIALLFNLTN